VIMNSMIPDLRNNKQLRTITVDLTPVLHGGENGGAKVFVLELLRRLAELAPQTQFVLLTQASSHQELAALDRANVRRVMVINQKKLPLVRSLRSLATNYFLPILRKLPVELKTQLKRHAGPLAYFLVATIKRRQSSTILRQIHADLLFCPFTAPTYFDIAVPTVSIIYDLQYKLYPEFFSAEDVVHRDQTFIDASRRSTVLAAISDYTRKTAIEHGNLDPAHIKTIPLHISQHSLRNAERDETILGRLHLIAGKYLIYPANFWKHKNHEMLLTAFGIARSSGRLAGDVRLICTGATGARQQWLKQAAHGLGLEKHVLFPGYLANAELQALMTNSAGMIFPSLYEGFGLPVIEAMATGIPVACSNVTSLPEVAGDAAILFDPRNPEEIAEAMCSLTVDKELTTRLIQAGEVRAAKFSDSRLMAEQYWEMFQQAAALHNPSNMLLGVYPDGWAGPNPRLGIAPSSQSRTLEMEIALPEWTPTTKVAMRLQLDKKTKGEVGVLRGQNATVSLPLPLEGGFFDIKLSPAFVPALAMRPSSDRRELSALMVKCEIASADGQRIVLFPETVSGADYDAAQRPARAVCDTQMRDRERRRPAHHASSGKHFPVKFSIITPSFNQGRFIERTLQSVAMQRGADIEHVVFDGASTDETIDVLKRFGDSVRWVSEKDRGQSDAVNKGILATKSDIIGWLNSDDIYYPDAIARVAAFFDSHPNVDVVYGEADHIDQNDHPFEPYPTEPWNFERLKDRCFICQPATFFRRRVVEQHGLLDSNLQYCMDYEYWLRLAKAGVQFAYIEEKLAGSRLYAENKTIGARVKVHAEINDVHKALLGKVPDRWLWNYTHAVVEEKVNRAKSPRWFALRMMIVVTMAAWRWNGQISPETLPHLSDLWRRFRNRTAIH
jgi:glycosyltransferase involved in cell wall biosynthesis